MRSRDNLILLCYPHHKRVDAFEQHYPAEVLRTYRVAHEAEQANYVVPEKALVEAIVNAAREDWMPNLVPVIAYLETNLSEIQHQSGMNFVSQLISDVFDVELHFELMRLLKKLPAERQSQLIEEQEHWIECRKRAADSAVVSEGGSLAPLEHNWRYSELSLERLKELRSRREKLS